jgi:precorrin-6Y C5,15-methyltransferase (decarboxylating)
VNGELSIVSGEMTVESGVVTVIGLSAAGGDDLSPRLAGVIAAADLLVGGQRHLGYFPHFAGERLAIGGHPAAFIEPIRQAVAAGRRVVVLASGDPLFYGIGATLRHYFSPEQLRIEAAPTAFQLAFAALAEPWDDAVLLSAHAHPLEAIVPRILAASKAAVLTDRENTPAAIARRLLAAGASPSTPCAVCENLGGEDERIVCTTLAMASIQEFAPLNVMVIWPQSVPPAPVSPGLPDDRFSTWHQQLTKREIRLLSLAELRLQPGEVMWDIGAGSGSVCIEAARSQPAAAVFAVEKRAELGAHIRENLARFPAPNLHLTEGVAPAATVDWPDPDAVFIGGSGGGLDKIIVTAQERLRPGGRLVLNLVVLENLAVARELLPEAAVTQVQINRGVPIVNLLRFEPLNPVFMVTWSKPHA